ncbi:UNVERIFIED_CONTAM: hypothetical protein Sradi_4834400 [Sesamum radiatum]|uniref:Uncharacterized protein n=1 Tax=Sesamum radiatum TaxID=300843 RepID=A0AAW2MXK1_SESRA
MEAFSEGEAGLASDLEAMTDNPVEKVQEEEISYPLEGIDFEELDGNEIEGDGRKDCEGQGVELGVDENWAYIFNNEPEFVAENFNKMLKTCLKGLVEVLKDLVPEAEHRFCLRHMYENFKVKFKSVELKEYFWKAASTSNERELVAFMKKIEDLDPKIKVEVETASECLQKINPQHWARSHFPVQSKCDILANIAEPEEIPQTAARGTRNEATRVTQPPAPRTTTHQQVGYFGPRNEALLGNVGSASTQAGSSIPANRRYTKRPTIDQVLEKMKERSKRR